MDRLTSMSVFVKAVDLGSFAAAAVALGLSAPMVGKHVRFLEDRLGARLLNRTTRRQSLTDVGRAYYERCRLVLAEAEAAEALAADHQAVPRGRLRVSMPVLLGRHCATPILLKLAERHPELELELSYSDRPVDLMADGIDLAVRNARVPDGSGLVVRRVARQSMVVCAAPAYLEHHGRPRRIEDLAVHRGVIYSRSGQAHPWLFPCEGRSPLEILPQNRLRLDDLSVIADTAAAGMGLAWLPCWLVRERIAAGHLVPVLEDRPAMVFDSYALWLQTPHLPLRLRVAIDALAAELPGYMAGRP